MIYVKNFNSSNNINIYNIINIFKPEEEVVFTDKVMDKDFAVECIYKDSTSIVNIYKHGVLNHTSTKYNSESNYSKIKTTINNLYEVLSKYYNYKSDYGTLTGIRPVKLVRKYLDKGINHEDLKIELKSKYLIDESKIIKLIDIAERERKLIDKSKISMYINIPFCPSKCSYCNFTSYVNKEEEIDRYIDFLIKDLKENINLIQKYSLRVESIYIGGGTPSVLSEANMEKLLSYCNQNIPEYKEFTFEAGRTDTLNEEKIKILKEYNVNRISLNPQSFKKETLYKLNRIQNISELNKYFKLCRENNIGINSDLILGLPGETIEDMKYSINELEKLKPDNITIHTLSIKKNTNLIKDQNILSNNIEKAYNYAYNKLTAKGYNPYYLYRQKNILGNLDNIGYSLEGRESLYNVNMIEESQTILSAGLGSVSKILDGKKTHRIAYNKNFKDYYHKYNYVNLNKEEHLKNQ